MARALSLTPARLAAFFADREYFSQLLSLALPIALQQFVMSALNMVSAVLVGQLGETSVAAVGLANQVYFLHNLLLFGIYSGAAMFTAQLWGKGDLLSLRKVTALALALGAGSSLVFTTLAVFLPGGVLGVYSADPAVIAVGSGYLRVFGWSYVFGAISFGFASVIRSTGDVRTPLAISISALLFSTLASYLLIFGKIGLPALGVQGAGGAGLAARILECAAMLWLVYRSRSPVAITLGDIRAIDRTFALRVLKPTLPAAINEFVWALGISAYNVVYARISTESVAAMNIASAIDQLAIVLFIGLGSACAIMLGNRIGANQPEKAFEYGLRSIFIAMSGAILVGGLVLAFSNVILGFYKVAPEVIETARRVLLVVAALLWVRMTNVIVFIGILRSGGDTRFALLAEGGVMWTVGVPLAVIGAFVLHLPVYWVYLLVMVEEITKAVIALRRFFSRRWIHDLAGQVAHI